MRLVDRSDRVSHWQVLWTWCSPNASDQHLLWILSSYIHIEQAAVLWSRSPAGHIEIISSARCREMTFRRSYRALLLQVREGPVWQVLWKWLSTGPMKNCPAALLLQEL